jgi:hypothetical protein
LLQDIHIAATAPTGLVELHVALGRNGICSRTGFHASALEGLGGLESLLAVGCVFGGLAGSCGAGGCDFAIVL